MADIGDLLPHLPKKLRTDVLGADLPWVESMSLPLHDMASPAEFPVKDTTTGTVAAFSPVNIAGSSLTSRQRSTVIVHRKSPLLVATPPPVTRALAYSHPFLLPLNWLLGLVAWDTGNPWQSFLLVASFWTLVIHGDLIILWAGPIVIVFGLILAMYSRRYSPLSSTTLTGEKHGGNDVADGHFHKTLDEIVDSLRTLTARCNIILEPLLEMTDFLSTQQTATSATTRPALTTLLMRIILISPIWVLLGQSPLYLITPRRIVLVVGTVILTWHSKPARIFRVILWRSLAIRRLCSALTGLQFSPPVTVAGDKQGSTRRSKNEPTIELSARKRPVGSPGVRFTFILFENQRRWLGIGWTSSLFSYERPPWTDEHLNPAPSKDDFELPEVQGDSAQWRWVPASQWHIEVDPVKKVRSANAENAEDGWIYYDNKVYHFS